MALYPVSRNTRVGQWAWESREEETGCFRERREVKTTYERGSGESKNSVRQLCPNRYVGWNFILEIASVDASSGNSNFKSCYLIKKQLFIYF